MEAPSTRVRAATTWANGNAVANAATSLHARAALQFAENRQYRDLLHAVQLRPEVAMACDAFAMTPLHWLCSDKDVPLRALQALVLAYPTATTMRNLAGLLPLHLAVRKDLSLDALKTVLKFYPKAVVAEMPDGKTPVQLAQQYVTSRPARHFLRKLEQEVRSLGRIPPSSSSSEVKSATNTRGDTSVKHTTDRSTDESSDAVVRGWEHGYPVAIVDSSLSQTSASQRSLEEPSVDSVGTRPLPPVWKLSDNCSVCNVKFGYFKKRHHCRNCGESVCGRHSRHSVPLKHLGLFHAQRVCSGCYGRLQSHYTSRAIARLSPHSRSARHVDDSVHEDTLPREFPHSPLHQRHMRTRSAHEMTFSQLAQQHPLLSPRVHQMRTPSPLSITPRPSTRKTRSATLSPSRSNRTTSTNTVRSGTSTTTASAFTPNFIKLPSELSMHLASVQRTGDQGNVLERQRELVRRRNRLANTDLETYAWNDGRSGSSNSVNNQDHDEDNELLLEMQMQKLLLAKKQIRDALQRSKREADHAQAEKDKYDELAKEFEQRGYNYSNESLEKEGRGANGTFVDSESGVDEIASITSSHAAAKYGYTSYSDNQNDHDRFSDLPYVDNNDDGEDSAVYALVPDTTPHEVVESSIPGFNKDTLDAPLDLAATYRDLGIVLLTKGDFAAASVELQRSLDIDDSSSQTWYHFAKALDGKGDSDAAETAIQRSLAIHPNSLPSLSLLGKLLNARGEHDEAIVVFRRALNLQCPSDTAPIRAY